GGKKVYHITPEGEAFLDDNKDLLSEIGERIKEAMHGVAGGAVGEVNSAFADLAKRVFKDAWRSGPDSERTAKSAEILRRAVADIEALGRRVSASLVARLRGGRRAAPRGQEARTINRRVDPELPLERAPESVRALEPDRRPDALGRARPQCAAKLVATTVSS